ncbi:MAG: ATP-binding protein [Candidatus Bathyarchaeota archaeon]|nr:ATP-binding protein [Candidatus Bathyarchaeota archaeon]
MIYTTEGRDNRANEILDIDVDSYFILKLSRDESTLLVKKIKTIVKKRRRDELTSVALNTGVNAIVIECENKIIFFNSVFKRLFSGYSDDIVGKSLSYFVSDVEWKNFQNLLQKGGEGIVDFTLEGGEKHNYQMWVNFSKINGKEVTIIQLQDITTTHLYEQRLKKLHEFAPKIFYQRNLEDLIKNTFNVIEANFDYELISFLIVERNELVCLDRRWRKRGFKLSLDGESIIARSVREGKSVTNYDHDNTLIDDIIIKSELSVPIRDRADVVAVLNLRSTKANAFTNDDIVLVEVLCIYIGCTYYLIRELQSVINFRTQYFELLKGLDEAVYLIIDSHFAYANQRGFELLGYKHSSEVVGKEISPNIAPKYLAILQERLKNKSNNEFIDNYEIKLVKNDGSNIDILVIASSVLFDGKPAYLIIEKVNENSKLMQAQLKKYLNYLENQVEKKNQELLESRQFVSAGKIASMVGHDLRSPLQSIRNATYLIRKQPERSEEMLTSIETSIERALSMLEDLRNQTMETSLKIESIDINKLITNITKEISPTENIEFVVNLDPELIAVEIDSLKIRRVIDNLLRNALEAMPNGGKLVIETKSDDDKFAITIMDTGVGIPEDRLPHLFKPFYTTKSKGLGLGLVYCKTAVEVHGGTIEVESKIGKGTVFKILLRKRVASKRMGL